MTVPVFILGVHRSGTTWVTQALADGGWGRALTVRHLLSLQRGRPLDVQQTAQWLAAEGIHQRPGDGLAVHPERSEEYGYALANAHGSSRTTTRSLPLLRALIARVASEAPGQPVLLRNPWDYAGAHRLHRWFPSARFLFVHRWPPETVASSVALFEAFFRTRHPYAWLMSARYRTAWSSSWRRRLLQWAAGRPSMVARVVARGTALAHAAHLIDAAGLPSECVSHVVYRDLLVGGGPVLERAVTHLGLSGPALVLESHGRSQRSHAWAGVAERPLLRATARWREARAIGGPSLR